MYKLIQINVAQSLCLIPQVKFRRKTKPEKSEFYPTKKIPKNRVYFQ